MDENEFQSWLSANLPMYETLTDSVVSIMKTLLNSSKIEYLTVEGRTKKLSHCLEKMRRKTYEQPALQMMDLSGIRIILYFDHNVQLTSNIIEQAFKIDSRNSVNKDDILLTNQLGYRSVHYVCELDDNRIKLPDYAPYKGLKFEIQVRTILQHAWAEMDHDRNYKYKGSLPKKLERELFLLSGMLEVADNGFSRLSKEIDNYIDDVTSSAKKGDLDFDINKLSLDTFIKQWALENDLKISDTGNSAIYPSVIRELKQFGITSINSLSKIIPDNYADKVRDVNLTPIGVVRNWMMIHDLSKFLKKVSINWVLGPKSQEVLQRFMDEEDIQKIRNKKRSGRFNS